MNMGLYRKKPVVIEANQWDGSRESMDTLCRWVNDGKDEPLLSYLFASEDDVFDAEIWTLEGPHSVSDGDFIIKGVAGEFYPCKPGIFKATYDEAL